MAWLNTFANFPDVISMYLYLESHKTNIGGYEQEALDFAEFALEALVEGGEVDYENEVIFDNSYEEDYQCQKEIIDDATRVCGPLSELFQEIFINSNRAQLTYKTASLGMLDGGYTVYAGANNNGILFETTLNTNRLVNSTNLDIITTVVHEYTHTILLYFFYASPSFNIDLNNPPSYAELVEQFSQHRVTIGNTNQSQHDYMAGLVDDIALVCYNWCLENNVSVTLDYMKKISWGGLTDTDTFDILYPENTLERNQIIDATLAEIFPNTPGYSDPVGTAPCDNN